MSYCAATIKRAFSIQEDHRIDAFPAKEYILYIVCIRSCHVFFRGEKKTLRAKHGFRGLLETEDGGGLADRRLGVRRMLWGSDGPLNSLALRRGNSKSFLRITIRFTWNTFRADYDISRFAKNA